MASSIEFVDYICTQLSGVYPISSRKMFGEYAIYCDNKVIGLVCDNQLFIKKTEGGVKLYPNCDEASPYTGAKPHLLIDFIDNKEALEQLIIVTYPELPEPKPKRK